MRKEIDYMRMAVMNTEGEEQEVCVSILRKLERKYKARRKFNRIRIAVLKTLTLIAMILFIAGIFSLDSVDATIPVIVTIVSGLWLALVTYANN